MADLKTSPVETRDSEEVKPQRRRPLRRTLWMVIGLVAGFVVYAYGFQVVDVRLDRIGDPVRQARFSNVIRALGQPDLLTYETVDTAIDVEFAMPCPAGGFTPAASDGEATISVSPACANPRDTVTITGEGFRANETINVSFVPPNGIELRVAQMRTASDGTFSAEATLPNRPDEEVQTIRAKSRETVGSILSPVYVPSGRTDPATGDEIMLRSPRWSQNAEATWKGIIETIFLALLATTVGTMIAMPLSFLAAKNLMSDVRIPALNVGLAIVALPMGALLGLAASSAAGSLVDSLPDSALLLGVVTLLLVWLAIRALRTAVPLPGTERSRLLRVGSGIAAAAAFLLAAQAAVRVMVIGGAEVASVLGSLAFLGRFVERLGEIMALAFGVLAAVAGAVALAILASKLSYAIAKKVSPGVDQVFSIIAVGLAGAVVAVGVGQVIAWVYQINDTTATVVIPAVIGAVIGLVIGGWGAIRRHLSAGLGVYYIFRTFFNTLRSIEALILALVFVIWVGLGAFAGTLALALHTVAANAKLYSEQVESISSGPLEAVRSTGATRLQTVVYAVVPQIVAPFIAFTMYRWDINVRMSTIIGFVGGGGIGLILQQNINLLNYRGAAAQILAIAIVVAAMDYVSSRLRERFV
ncbi:MAG TPA: ABC transporter permease subunit [Acidimicrobiia bacterium]